MNSDQPFIHYYAKVFHPLASAVHQDKVEKPKDELPPYANASRVYPFQDAVNGGGTQISFRRYAIFISLQIIFSF